MTTPRRRPVRRLAVALLVTALGAWPGTAATALLVEPGYWERGQKEFGFLVGFAAGQVLHTERVPTEFVQTSIRLAVNSGPVRGTFGGNAAFVAELMPFFMIDQEPSAYGFGLNTLGRYMFRGTRVRPLIVGGAGILLANRDIPEGESAFNYTPQVGAGVQVLVGQGTALGLEYRLHHISNGDLTPDNPGINTHQVILSLSWY